MDNEDIMKIRTFFLEPMHTTGVSHMSGTKQVQEEI